MLKLKIPCRSVWPSVYPARLSVGTLSSLPPCLTCLIENPEQYLVPRAPPAAHCFLLPTQNKPLSIAGRVCVAQFFPRHIPPFPVSQNYPTLKTPPHLSLFAPSPLSKPSNTKHFSISHPGNWKLLATYNHTDRLNRVAQKSNTTPIFINPPTYPRWTTPATPSPRVGLASPVSLPSQFLRPGFCLPRVSERNCRHPPQIGMIGTLAHDASHLSTGRPLVR